MKKLLAMLLTLTLFFAFVACNSNDEPKFDASAKSEGVMTYAEYDAAELDTPVVIEAYVQATQSWWDNKLTIYAQDPDGAYFIYNAACTKDDAAKLVPGTKIKVTGHKGAWAGEVEVMDATFEIVTDGTWIADAFDATALLGTDDLIKHQNEKVAFKGLTVEASNDAGAAFLYNWDGSGEAGTDSDLYFKASVGGNTYTFVIEYYLTGADSDAYKAVQGLKVGDTIDLEGFLYWYEGSQPHITTVTVK